MKKRLRGPGSAALMLLAVACAGQPKVDNLVAGQDVAITKSDGGVVEGKVARLDDKSLHVTTGQTTRAIPKDQIVDMKVVNDAKPVALPAAAKFHEYTVPVGSPLSLRLATAINSETSRVEDPVEATLVDAVSVAGIEVLPAGSMVKGTVSAVEASGKVKGLARISVRFTTISAAGRNDHYPIDAVYSEVADTTKRDDATKIGIGAGAGAAIGGILGGKGGAAKGAAIGGGAGTAAVLATKGEEVSHGAGSVLTVRLNNSLDVRVPIG